MLAVTEANILTNVNVKTREEVIRLLIDLLVQNDCVTPEYYDIIIAREEKYPTGLPTEGVKVAIPHGFSEGCVLKPSVGIATLTRPVIFKNMGNDQEELVVEIVFLFALSSEDKNAADLNRVMSVFSDSTLLMQLRSAANSREVMELMQEVLKDME